VTSPLLEIVATEVGETLYVTLLLPVPLEYLTEEVTWNVLLPFSPPVTVVGPLRETLSTTIFSMIFIRFWPFPA
jgi:hypothetical protein